MTSPIEKANVLGCELGFFGLKARHVSSCERICSTKKKKKNGRKMFKSVTKLLLCLRINGGVPRHCRNIKWEVQ